MIVYSAHEVALKSFTYIKVIFPLTFSLLVLVSVSCSAFQKSMEILFKLNFNYLFASPLPAWL